MLDGLPEVEFDFVKDDHSLAEQDYAPFAARLEAITEMLRKLEQEEGCLTRYLPNLSGDLDMMRGQIAAAEAAGVVGVLVAPMIAGLSNVHRLVKDHRQLRFIAHPALAGASRIAPPLLLGKMFRLIGADGIIFPNFGGRFAYSADTCQKLARAATAAWPGVRASVPVPAGGMAPGQTHQVLDFYGPDTMLLIGGALLEAGAALTTATADFVAAVQSHAYESKARINARPRASTAALDPNTDGRGSNVWRRRGARRGVPVRFTSSALF